MASYKDAFARMRANKFAIWAPKNEQSMEPHLAAARIHNGYADIAGPTDLTLPKDARFFCVGSCFAREIEDAIETVGFDPATKTMFLKTIADNPDEFERNAGVMGRPTAFLNRYNLGSMADLMQEIAGMRDADEGLLYSAGGGNFHDYHYTRLFKSKSLEQCNRRRALITETYREAAASADVFVFTLGLCESFFDLASKRYLNVTPDPKAAVGQDLEFQFLSLEQNLEAGKKVIEAVTALRPDAKIILTVSPVPLDATFTDMDVVVANSLAKSTLVVAAQTLTQTYEQCKYFPSYDMVMNSTQEKAWLWDRKHVAQPMVNHIMKTFTDRYAQ
jgi:hypothetical protein